MGKPMALNLLTAGYEVQILQSSHAASELIEAGAKAFPNSKVLASASDIIITIVPDSPQVEEVVLGKDGVWEGIKSGSLFIDMSTISPSTARKLYSLFREKGIEALDAPVSGGQVGAEAGSLSIMVGGNETAFQRALPVFEVLGKNIVLIGEAGAGQTTKACNQMIVGMTIQAVAEAFTLAEKAGVDLKKMREVLLGGFAHSRILDLHGNRMIEANYKPGFKIKLHKKDMDIALQEAEHYNLQLAGTAQVAKQMDTSIAMGNGELDHSSLVLVLKDNA